MPSSSPSPQEPQGPNRQPPSRKIEAIFADFEARNNFVGVFEVLLKVDRRISPENYD